MSLDLDISAISDVPVSIVEKNEEPQTTITMSSCNSTEQIQNTGPHNDDDDVNEIKDFTIQESSSMRLDRKHRQDPFTLEVLHQFKKMKIDYETLLEEHKNSLKYLEELTKKQFQQQEEVQNLRSTIELYQKQQEVYLNKIQGLVKKNIKLKADERKARLVKSQGRRPSFFGNLFTLETPFESPEDLPIRRTLSDESNLFSTTSSLRNIKSNPKTSRHNIHKHLTSDDCEQYRKVSEKYLFSSMDESGKRSSRKDIGNNWKNGNKKTFLKNRIVLDDSNINKSSQNLINSASSDENHSSRKELKVGNRVPNKSSICSSNIALASGDNSNKTPVSRNSNNSSFIRSGQYQNSNNSSLIRSDQNRNPNNSRSGQVDLSSSGRSNTRKTSKKMSLPGEITFSFT